MLALQPNPARYWGTAVRGHLRQESEAAPTPLTRKPGCQQHCSPHPGTPSRPPPERPGRGGLRLGSHPASVSLGPQGLRAASATAEPASRPARGLLGAPFPPGLAPPSRPSRDANPARSSRAHPAATGAATAGRQGPPWRDAAEAGVRRLRGRREDASTDSRGPAAAAPARRDLY